jgi:uncharacterized membrane protein YecN with MAPEG domain
MTTPLYAAALAFLLIYLSFHVIKGRMKYKAAFGDAGAFEMQRRIRAQANCAEYAPLFIILLYLAETGGLPFWGVHLIGVIFLAGRLMHAYSVTTFEQYDEFGQPDMKTMKFRMRGMMCTFFMLQALIVILLVQYILQFVL